MKNKYSPHIVIDSFPEKGATVLGYVHQKGHGKGHFYVGVVEASGAKQFKIHWSDECTEVFKRIEGRDDCFQYFAIFGYISRDDYLAFKNTRGASYGSIDIFEQIKVHSSRV